MRGLLSLLSCVLVLGLLFTAADAQACNQFSQQVQFNSVQSYAAPVLFQQQVAAVEYAVAPQFVVSQKFIAPQLQQVEYFTAPQLNVAYSTAPQFLAVGCSRAGCSRAAIGVGGPRRAVTANRGRVSRTRIRN